VEASYITCNTCFIDKDKDNFSGRRKYCNACHAKKSRERYLKDFKVREKIKQNTYERITQNKEKAVEYLGGKCLDCNGIFPKEVYDFHHVDPSTKEKELTSARFQSWDNYKKELDKCVLLCSNCHRIRHRKEKHG
jgi:hypothetical protein